MVKEIEAQSKRAAFLSTPSVFFSLSDTDLIANSKVFDVRSSLWLSVTSV